MSPVKGQPTASRAGDPLSSLPEFLARVRTADGLFAVDTQQRIVHWSATAEALFGLRAREVVGRLCHEVVGGRDARNLRVCRRNCPVVANARRGRPTKNYDLRVRSGAGREIWANVSILVMDQDGPPSRLVLHLLRDITERSLLEERAVRVMEAVRQAVGGRGGAPAAVSDPCGGPTPKLSRRESEVLCLLALGLSTQEIASSLGVSRITARNHIGNLLTKLGAENRLQAVVYASRLQLV